MWYTIQTSNKASGFYYTKQMVAAINPLAIYACTAVINKPPSSNFLVFSVIESTLQQQQLPTI